MCEDTYTAVQSFLSEAREPCAVEPGQDPLPLQAGSYDLTQTSGFLVLQVWSDTTNLVRRITGIEGSSPGRLELRIERFGKKTGVLYLIDKAHRNAEKTTRHAGRLVFREWLRRALSRHFAGWRLRELSAEPDLEHSLSPAYTRAFLTKGTAAWAAIGAPPDASDPDGALTFGLIWLDYLRRREPRMAIEGLAVFLPEGRERTTCLRIRHLDPVRAAFAVIVYADGWDQRIDVADAGNLETSLAVCETSPDLPAWAEEISAIRSVERIDLARDHVSWRVRGLEFARWDGKAIRFGLNSRHAVSASDMPEIRILAAELARIRSARSANADNPLYTSAPERWLESVIRRDLSGIDAELRPSPVYGQVPAFAAAERGVLDILACGFDGRLAVIEVKAKEDLQLPLQALDYWMRVRYHAAQDDFARNGYFPGATISRRPPRLLLVAPALHFHPSTETVLRFFLPTIEVVRIGLSINWREDPKVVFRASGCLEPVQCDDND